MAFGSGLVRADSLSIHDRATQGSRSLLRESQANSPQNLAWSNRDTHLTVSLAESPSPGSLFSQAQPRLLRGPSHGPPHPSLYHTCGSLDMPCWFFTALPSNTQPQLPQKTVPAPPRL